MCAVERVLPMLFVPRSLGGVQGVCGVRSLSGDLILCGLKLRSEKSLALLRGMRGGEGWEGWGGEGKGRQGRQGRERRVSWEEQGG